MAVDEGLIGAMRATQHAIALIWGALIGPWRDRLAPQGARSTEAIASCTEAGRSSESHSASRARRHCSQTSTIAAALHHGQRPSARSGSDGASDGPPREAASLLPAHNKIICAENKARI